MSSSRLKASATRLTTQEADRLEAGAAVARVEGPVPVQDEVVEHRDQPREHGCDAVVDAERVHAERVDGEVDDEADAAHERRSARAAASWRAGACRGAVGCAAVAPRPWRPRASAQGSERDRRTSSLAWYRMRCAVRAPTVGLACLLAAGAVVGCGRRRRGHGRESRASARREGRQGSRRSCAGPARRRRAAQGTREGGRRPPGSAELPGARLGAPRRRRHAGEGRERRRRRGPLRRRSARASSQQMQAVGTQRPERPASADDRGPGRQVGRRARARSRSPPACPK